MNTNIFHYLQNVENHNFNKYIAYVINLYPNSVKQQKITFLNFFVIKEELQPYIKDYTNTNLNCKYYAKFRHYFGKYILKFHNGSKFNTFIC